MVQNRMGQFRFFLTLAPLEFVFEALPCNREWRRLLSGRIGGEDITNAFLHDDYIDFEAVDNVLSLATRLFRAVGRNDIILGKRRFVLLLGDASPMPEEVSFPIYLLIDKRNYTNGLRAKTCKGVKHFICEYGHTLDRGYQSLIDADFLVGDEFGFKNTDLHAVYLPNVEIVLPSVFAHCTRLKWISMPKVKRLAESTFEVCENLEYIYCPCVQSVAKQAFYYCFSLFSISLPHAIQVGLESFLGCAQLSMVTLPRLRYIAPKAFRKCSLSGVHFPETEKICAAAFEICQNIMYISCPLVTAVDSSAFFSCAQLTTVSLPSVKIIALWTFGFCVNLSAVDLPSVRIISRSAFYGCTSLKSICLPSVGKIGAHAFTNCANLTTISMPVISQIELSGFTNCFKLDAKSLVDISRVQKTSKLAIGACL